MAGKGCIAGKRTGQRASSRWDRVERTETEKVYDVVTVSLEAKHETRDAISYDALESRVRVRIRISAICSGAGTMNFTFCFF